MLLRGAEVAGEVGDAERLVLADAHPALVLHRPRDAVQEDPEGLPDGLLAHWARRGEGSVRPPGVLPLLLCSLLLKRTYVQTLSSASNKPSYRVQPS